MIIWNEQPQLDTAEALRLLGEHKDLVREVCIHGLTRHLFDHKASGTPLRENAYSPAGMLQAQAEFVYRAGEIYLDGNLPYLLAGDLIRMSNGGASQVAAQISRARAPFEDIDADNFRRLVLQAGYLARLDGGEWVDKVKPLEIPPRTLKRRASKEVPAEDRKRARQIGRMVKNRGISILSSSLSEYITRYSMDEWRAGFKTRRVQRLVAQQVGVLEKCHFAYAF